MCHTRYVSKQKKVLHPELASGLAVDIRSVSGKLKRRLREHAGSSDLRPSQVSVLLLLEKNGSTTVSGLARAEGVRPQSMSAVVNSLQDAKLVSGAPDLKDGRQTLISLTPKCLKWLQEGRAARQDWLTTAITQKLSIHEQEKLHSALQLLTRLVED